MSFPRIYSEIKEMVASALLETSMTRDIVRKSGVQLGGQALATSTILYYGQDHTSLSFAASWGFFPREGVTGFWPVPENLDEPGLDPTDFHDPGGQLVWVDLRGLAYVRVVAVVALGATSPDTAFLPVYTTLTNPMTYGPTDTQALDFWRTPDGRTLLEWHEDYGPGGPKSFEWPPVGSLVYPRIGGTGFGDGCHGGRWAPPPAASLGTPETMVGVAVIYRGPTEDAPQDQIASVQVQAIPTEGVNDAFRTRYLGQIDD